MIGLGNLKVTLGRILFNIVSWAVSQLIERIIYRLVGVTYHRDQIRSGKETVRTAEVLDVIMKYPEAGWMAIRLKSTILLHRRFVEPEYVLQPHIKLMTYEDGLVYFAICSPDENVYDTKKYPFLFWALPECCEKVVTMSLSDLTKLGDRIGKPQCDISLIFHLTRSGSTALVQALNSIPGHIVLSESRFWMACYSELLPIKGEDYGRSEECQKLYRASLNVVLKDFTPETRLTIKAIGGGDHEFLLPHAIKNWPNARVIYMYRDAQSVVGSMWRSVGPKGEDDLKKLLKWARMSPRGKQQFLIHVCILSCSLDPDALASGDKLTQARLLLLGWIRNMRYLRKYGKDVTNMRIIRFEEFVSDREHEVAKVFEFLGIPHKHLSVALDALRSDSQRGTLLGETSLKKATRWIPDPRELEWCQMICQKYDMPSFGRKFKMRDDLTVDELLD